MALKPRPRDLRFCRDAILAMTHNKTGTLRREGHDERGNPGSGRGVQVYVESGKSVERSRASNDRGGRRGRMKLPGRTESPDMIGPRLSFFSPLLPTVQFSPHLHIFPFGRADCLETRCRKREIRREVNFPRHVTICGGITRGSIVQERQNALLNW